MVDYAEKNALMDTLLYTAVISCLLRKSPSRFQLDKAFGILHDKMLSQPHMSPTARTYSILIGGCTKRRDFDRGIAFGNKSKMPIVKDGRMTRSKCSCKTLCWNIAMAMELFDQMQHEAFLLPDAVTIATLLKGCSVALNDICHRAQRANTSEHDRETQSNQVLVQVKHLWSTAVDLFLNQNNTRVINIFVIQELLNVFSICGKLQSCLF
ncbi:hypothetical protein RFI_37022, partial [Reticulomyxa filosa]